MCCELERMDLKHEILGRTYVVFLDTSPSIYKLISIQFIHPFMFIISISTDNQYIQFSTHNLKVSHLHKVYNL